MSQMSEQEVQAYLDQHKIQTTVEDAINACVKANAADPCLFMSQHLASKAGPETITGVKARQIFDSRGNPTVEVEVATTKGKFTVDGLRRVLEDMGPEFFETHSYYERWIESVNRNLIESGRYSTAELAAKLEEVRARGETYGECSLTAPEAGSGPEAGDG